MGTTTDKLDYLSTTKAKIKDAINLTGVNITNDTFRSYETKLKQGIVNTMNDLDVVWANFTKVTGTGNVLMLTPTEHAPIRISQLKGSTTQAETVTPSSPKQIHVVSGDNTIQICGKNLFNIQTIVKGRLDNGVVGYANGTTNLTKNDNSFSFTTNANYRGVVSDYIETKPNTNYVFKSSVTSGITRAMACYDKNKTFLGNATSVLLEDESRKYTTLENTKYVRYGIQLNTAGTLTIENPQLEKGSSASTYEAYTGNSQLISLGLDNYFNQYDLHTINASISSSGIYSSSSAKTLYIKVKPNTTYTITKISSTRFRVGTTTNVPTTSGTLNQYQSTSETGTTETITTGDNDNYLLVYYYLSGTDTLTEQQVINSIRVYIPNENVVELCKIGSYQDYIYKSNGKWYLHKEIGKVVLNYNLSSWQVNSAFTSEYMATKTQLGIDLPQNSLNFISTHFKGIATAPASLGSMRIGGSYICFNYDNGSGGINTFKTWLQNNNVVVYYALSSATDTEITDATLLGQLNSLDNLKSYYKTTNISQANNDAELELTATAIKEVG